MGTWAHGLALLEGLAAQCITNLTSSLGLKFVSVGQLYQHAMETAMSDNVPCILLSVLDVADVDAGNVGATLMTVYPIRVVYVDQFADAEKVESLKATAIEAIANDLMDNRNLSSISLTAGYVTNARLESIEYTAAEEIELRPERKDIVAAALTFMVEVKSTGS